VRRLGRGANESALNEEVFGVLEECVGCCGGFCGGGKGVSRRDRYHECAIGEEFQLAVMPDGCESVTETTGSSRQTGFS
jgi:hypothetical protein